MLRTLFLSLAVLSTTIASAQEAGQQGGMTGTLVMLAVMGAFFYFMIIRPNKKRQTEHQNLMNELKKGSEVITSSGIIGKVADVAEGYILVEIAPNVTIKLQRQAIISMVPKGTYKSEGGNKNQNSNKKPKKEEKVEKDENTTTEDNSADTAEEETVDSSDHKENNG